MRAAGILVAAGRGLRLGGEPKQWRALAGSTVAGHALAALRRAGVSPIAVVHHPDDADRARTLGGDLAVPGGATRADSVRAGLEALVPHAPEAVLIHDAARPCLPVGVVRGVLAALERSEAAAPALPVTDALWRGAATVEAVAARDGLWRAQTPQGFRFASILAAHRARGDAAEAADDVAVARAAGLAVAIVPGDEDNIKVTHPGDLARAARILEGRMEVRTGHGYDVHAFGEGDHVMLCGVRVPHARGVVAHSDGDVGLHALTDAILGALCAGDIGQHFPPSDPAWRGAPSLHFLRHARVLADAAGFRVTHADVTLVCEAPRVGPHAAAMREAVGGALGLGAEAVSVKATTSERMGFTGRGEGLAAFATATLVRP